MAHRLKTFDGIRLEKSGPNDVDVQVGGRQGDSDSFLLVVQPDDTTPAALRYNDNTSQWEIRVVGGAYEPIATPAGAVDLTIAYQNGNPAANTIPIAAANGTIVLDIPAGGDNINLLRLSNEGTAPSLVGDQGGVDTFALHRDGDLALGTGSMSGTERLRVAGDSLLEGDVRSTLALTLEEQGGAPGNLADTGRLFTQEVFGVTQLFYLPSVGPAVQLSPPGVGNNTLDQAYDQGGAGAGRTIDVSDGAVELSNSQDAGVILDINSGGGLVGALTAMDIDLSGVGATIQEVNGIAITMPPSTSANSDALIISSTQEDGNLMTANLTSATLSGTVEGLRVGLSPVVLGTGGLIGLNVNLTPGTAGSTGMTVMQATTNQTGGTWVSWSNSGAPTLAADLTGLLMNMNAVVVGGNTLTGIDLFLPAAGIREALKVRDGGGTNALLLGDGDLVLGAGAPVGTERLSVIGGSIHCPGSAGTGNERFGLNADVTVNDGVAFGNGATVAAVGGVAIGQGASIVGAGSTNSLAIGDGASVSVLNGIAIGTGVTLGTNGDTIAITHSQALTALRGTFVGMSITIAGSNNVLVGAGANVGDAGVAVGRAAVANGTLFSIGVGHACNVTGTRSIGIGQGATVSVASSIAIGDGVSATGNDATVVGANSSVAGDSLCVILGNDNSIPGGGGGNRQIIIGTNNTFGTGSANVIIGHDIDLSVGNGFGNVLIGRQISNHNVQQTVAIGDLVDLGDNNANVAIGYQSSTTGGVQCTAIGVSAFASGGNQCMAIGHTAQATGAAGQVVIGVASSITSTSTNLLVLGSSSTISSSGSNNMILGRGCSITGTGSSNILVGPGCSTGNQSNVIIGVNRTVNEINCVLIGTNAQFTPAGFGASVIIGQDASGGGQMVVIGRDAGTTQGGLGCVFIGNNAQDNSAAGAGGQVVIGGAAKGAATRNVVIGDQAQMQSGGSGILIGTGSTLQNTGTNNIILTLGNVTVAGGNDNNILIGVTPSVTGTDQIAIGRSATVTGGDSAIAIGVNTSAAGGTICLGRGATATTANSMVVGSNTVPINNYWLGEGESDGSPTDINVAPTKATGTDIPAADFNVDGGQSTGTGARGLIRLRTCDPAGGSGAGLNALNNRLVVSDVVESTTMFALHDPASEAVGAGGTVTMDGGYKRINSAGNITLSAVTALGDPANTSIIGQVVWIHNDGSNDITIPNAANTALEGGSSVKVGPGDVVGVIWDGTNWRNMTALIKN